MADRPNRLKNNVLEYFIFNIFHGGACDIITLQLNYEYSVLRPGRLKNSLNRF